MGPHKWTLLQDPQQILSHFSLHFSLIHLTHMHNFIRNIIQNLTYRCHKTGENFKNEGFNLRDNINVCCEIVSIYIQRSRVTVLAQKRAELFYLTKMGILCVWGNVNTILILDIGGMILIGEKEVFRIILSQCQIVQKNSHMA